MLDAELVKTPGTDEWWITRLSRSLGGRLKRVSLLESWYMGDPPLPMQELLTNIETIRLQKLARVNLAELVVKAVLHHLEPLAFTTAAASDDNGDVEAKKIWRANDMFVNIETVFQWMLTLSESYVLVDGMMIDGQMTAIITPEHPSQFITEQNPARPQETIAALKIYRDDLMNRDVAVLYRPGYSRVAYHEGDGTILPAPNVSDWVISSTSWTFSEETTPSLTSRIPVQRFINADGKGEFEKHLELLNLINHEILQKLIIITFQAFRQRAIEGMQTADEETGEPFDFGDIFTSSPDSMWMLPEGAKMWESAQGDITPILQSIKDEIHNLAIVTSTPLHLFVPDAANGSAEGAALQRETLLAKVRSAMNRVSLGLANVLSLAFEVQGDDVRSNIGEIDVKWKDPAQSSLTERAASAAQAKAAGAPWRIVMEEFLQLTPDQIRAAKLEMIADQFNGFAPPVAPVAPANAIQGGTPDATIGAASPGISSVGNGPTGDRLEQGSVAR